MNFRRPRRAIPELDLTPLIDVIFQLLIFFLITTTFVSSPGMSIQRPKAQNSGSLQDKRLTIEIPKEAGDTVVFEGKRLGVNELRAALMEAFKKNPETQVAIDADAQVEHRRVVEIMDVATGVGFQRIGIVTSPNPQK
ncbi:MAG: biopolymer transporter ExbD [Myxococcales bacterium]|nr:biopolymer transporter ExbD [Myxococcales bacterium]